MPNLRAVNSPFATPDDVETLAKEKLASSGIPPEVAVKAGISWLSAEETKQLHISHNFLPSLKIDYIDPWTGEAYVPGKNWKPLYRLRMLREPVPLPEDFRKYTQEPQSGVGAYFPAIVNWPEILKDPAVSLIITEGELKALKATYEGFPTIGLGGVWSWRAMKQGHSFLLELEKTVWPHREVFIIYDSDCASNPQVQKALNALAEELLMHGALPRTLLLPASGETKVGLDDYLITAGAPGLKSLMEAAEHLMLAQPLWTLNDTYVYVKTPGFVVEQASGVLYKPDAFAKHVTTARYAKGVMLPNGTLNREMVSAAPVWLQWPFRNEARRMCYLPGQTSRAVVEHEGEQVFNTWPGWGCQPKKGDVKPFKQLVDHLFSGAEPEAKKWFLQWLAYPLVHPGTKLLTSVVLHSRFQGNGKSLIGVTMGKIYGDNYTLITQETLGGAFNHWANGRQFIMLDDVTSSEKKRDLDRLKTMITQEMVWINLKHVPEFSIRSCSNLYFSSNHQDVLLLEQMDRRFFIHEAVVGPLSAEFYAAYDTWVHGPDGGPALFDYLLHVDLTGFNPNAAPPVTAAKKKMTALAKNDISEWIDDVLAHPDEMLTLAGLPLKSDILTLREIRACYVEHAGHEPEISQVGLARKLATHGVQMVNNGDVLYVTHRPLDRYYVLRNRDRWHRATLDQVKRYLGGIAADVKNPVDKNSASS